MSHVGAGGRQYKRDGAAGTGSGRRTCSFFFTFLLLSQGLEHTRYGGLKCRVLLAVHFCASTRSTAPRPNSVGVLGSSRDGAPLVGNAPGHDRPHPVQYGRDVLSLLAVAGTNRFLRGIARNSHLLGVECYSLAPRGVPMSSCTGCFAHKCPCSVCSRPCV